MNPKGNENHTGPGDLLTLLQVRLFILETIRFFADRRRRGVDDQRTQPIPVATPRVALPEPENAARALRHAVMAYYAEHRKMAMAPELVKALRALQEHLCYATLLLAIEVVKRDQAARDDLALRRTLADAELALLVAPGGKEKKHAYQTR